MHKKASEMTLEELETSLKTLPGSYERNLLVKELGDRKTATPEEKAQLNGLWDKYAHTWTASPYQIHRVSAWLESPEREEEKRKILRNDKLKAALAIAFFCAAGAGALEAVDSAYAANNEREALVRQSAAQQEMSQAAMRALRKAKIDNFCTGVDPEVYDCKLNASYMKEIRYTGDIKVSLKTGFLSAANNDLHVFKNGQHPAQGLCSPATYSVEAKCTPYEKVIDGKIVEYGRAVSVPVQPLTVTASFCRGWRC